MSVCPQTRIYLRGTAFVVSVRPTVFYRLWGRAMRRRELIEVLPRRLYVNPLQIIWAEPV